LLDARRPHNHLRRQAFQYQHLNRLWPQADAASFSAVPFRISPLTLPTPPMLTIPAKRPLIYENAPHILLHKTASSCFVIAKPVFAINKATEVRNDST
jgi:hypothetical protein